MVYSDRCSWWWVQWHCGGCWLMMLLASVGECWIMLMGPGECRCWWILLNPDKCCCWWMLFGWWWRLIIACGHTCVVVSVDAWCWWYVLDDAILCWWVFVLGAMGSWLMMIPVIAGEWLWMMVNVGECYGLWVLGNVGWCTCMMLVVSVCECWLVLRNDGGRWWWHIMGVCCQCMMVNVYGHWCWCVLMVAGECCCALWLMHIPECWWMHMLPNIDGSIWMMVWWIMLDVGGSWQQIGHVYYTQ